MRSSVEQHGRIYKSVACSGQRLRNAEARDSCDLGEWPETERRGAPSAAYTDCSRTCRCGRPGSRNCPPCSRTRRPARAVDRPRSNPRSTEYVSGHAVEAERVRRKRRHGRLLVDPHVSAFRLSTEPTRAGAEIAVVVVELGVPRIPSSCLLAPRIPTPSDGNRYASSSSVFAVQPTATSARRTSCADDGARPVTPVVVPRHSAAPSSSGSKRDVHRRARRTQRSRTQASHWSHVTLVLHSANARGIVISDCASFSRRTRLVQRRSHFERARRHHHHLGTAPP